MEIVSLDLLREAEESDKDEDEDVDLPEWQEEQWELAKLIASSGERFLLTLLHRLCLTLGGKSTFACQPFFIQRLHYLWWAAGPMVAP